MHEAKGTPAKKIDHKKGRLFVRIFLVSLWSLFLLIVFAEIFLRFVPIPGLSQDDLNPDYLKDSKTHRTGPHPYLAYCLKPGWKKNITKKNPGLKSHNKHGFRGPELTLKKPKSAFRIACLGGSSTYGNTPSSDAATWPVRLETHLSKAIPGKEIQVMNCGAPGWSTFESTINLAFRVVEFKPDLIIVYHSVNDMRCALYKKPVMDNIHWRELWPVFRSSPIEPVFEKSVCYLIWRKYFTTYFQERADLNYVAIVDPPPPNSDWYAKPGDKISHIGFTNFRRNLINIIAIARAHGAKVILGTQGFDFSDFNKKLKSAPVQFKSMNKMTRILKDVAAMKKIFLVDAKTVLEETSKKIKQETGEDAIFTWEVHLTDKGADLLAETFAKRILKEKIIQ